MALKIANILKANLEISSAASVIEPALASAGITSINVSGKATPASEAPLADQISALIAVAKPGAASSELSELITSNDIISRELEKVKTDHAISKSSVDALTQENAKIKTDLQTTQASVSTLTASNAELQNRHEAAVRQVSETTGKLNALNTEISKACLSVACLELVDADGKAVSATASDEAKLSAANAIPAADKLKSYAGAVNSAIAKTGVDVSKIPNAGSKQETMAAVGNRAVKAQYDSITDAQEKVTFYRKNKEAIDATYRQ